MKTAHFTKFVQKSQRHKSVNISDKRTQKHSFFRQNDTYKNDKINQYKDYEIFKRDRCDD